MLILPDGNTYTPKSLDVIVMRGKWFNPLLLPVLLRTQSYWTHVVVVRGVDGRIYDAHFNGVEERSIYDYKKRYVCVLRRTDLGDIPQQSKIKMIEWADQLVKDKNDYDYWALIGFYIGLKSFVKDDNKWYCAEIPYYMWEYFWKPMFNERLKYVWPSDHYRNNCYEIVCEGVIE